MVKTRNLGRYRTKFGPVQFEAPLSRATNAHELLQDVVKVILEEPRRVNMDLVVDHFNPASHRMVLRGYMSDMDTPPCGTVGCVGGWTGILSGIGCALDLDAVFKMLTGSKIIATTAGTPPLVTDTFNLFFEDFPPSIPGTPQYAAAVVKRIRAYMRKHKAALVARKISIRRKEIK